MDFRNARVRAAYRIGQILAKGSMQRGSFFDVKRLANNVGKPRFVIIVSKKSSPKAVERNRIKRRTREALRIVAEQMIESLTDFSIIAKSKCLTAPFNDLVSELGRLIK